MDSVDKLTKRGPKTGQEREDRLFQIADAQQGFFTAQQAVEAGYDSASTSYHAKVGNWLREHRGIYRLRNYPRSDQSDLVVWSLWSRNRDQVPQGVYSHETALDIYGLTELIPSKLHMTVPTGFRRTHAAPDILVLHSARLSQDDLQVMRGFSVTRPIRAIKDLLSSRSLPSDILAQALESALRRGLLTNKEIGSGELGEMQRLLRTIS
jgi:predicted transcriptional regulator of viral defense system